MVGKYAGRGGVGGVDRPGEGVAGVVVHLRAAGVSEGDVTVGFAAVLEGAHLVEEGLRQAGGQLQALVAQELMDFVKRHLL